MDAKPPRDSTKATVIDMKTARDELLRLRAERRQQAGEKSEDKQTFNRHDVGNAQRFAEQHRGRAIYVTGLGWLVYDGKRWARDPDKLQAMTLAKQTAQSLLEEAEASLDTTDILKFYVASNRRERLNAMIDLARELLAVPFSKLDADPFALNCLNGTINLRTGKLRAHDYRDYVTKLAPVAYNPKAKAPRFKKFLKEILKFDDLVRYMQRVCGYAATGDVREQIILILWGTGTNGKGTLINILAAAVGDYFDVARSDLVIVKKNSFQSNLGDIAALRGLRMVSISETDDTHRLDETSVKNLTGDEPSVTGKFLYHDQFSFPLICKIFLSTNYKPIVHGTDRGIWRRLKLISFDRHYLTKKEYEQEKRENPSIEKDSNYKLRDNQLKGVLRSELEGVLAWIVAGAVAWFNRGDPNLREPDRVANAGLDFKREMDKIADFVAEECEKGPDYTELHSVLYARFAAYLKDHGLSSWTSNTFGRELAWARYERDTTKPNVTWIGLKLRN